MTKVSEKKTKKTKQHNVLILQRSGTLFEGHSFQKSYLLHWPTSKTVWVEFIGMKHMNCALNTKMVELAGNLESQEIILSEQENKKQKRNISMSTVENLSIHYNALFRILSYILRPDECICRPQITENLKQYV